MNLRVRSVTGCSRSAMIAVFGKWVSRLLYALAVFKEMAYGKEWLNRQSNNQYRESICRCRKNGGCVSPQPRH